MEQMVSSPDGEPSRKRSKTTSTQIAYLGPPGTYGHQAALGFARILSDSADLVPCPDITSIYSSPAPYLVMPIQNTIHGGVSETLDCLLSTSIPAPLGVGSLAGPSRSRVMGDWALPIRHSLVAKRGVRMEDIRWVRSHEQALGQSSTFLSTHLPHAERRHWPSTAGAALSLLEDDNEEDGRGAAICSRAVLDDHPELVSLREGIQSAYENYTRFLLLGRDDTELPAQSLLSSPTMFFALSDPASISRLVKHATILSIHSRPSILQLDSSPSSPSGLFPSRYLVEVGHTPEQDEASRLIEGMEGDDSIQYLGTCRHRISSDSRPLSPSPKTILNRALPVHA